MEINLDLKATTSAVEPKTPEITVDNEGVSWVSAKEIYYFLQINGDFMDWFCECVEYLNLRYNKDLIRVFKRVDNEWITHDFIVSLKWAVYISLLSSRGERGKILHSHLIPRQRFHKKESDIMIDLYSRIVEAKLDDRKTRELIGMIEKSMGIFP